MYELPVLGGGWGETSIFKLLFEGTGLRDPSRKMRLEKSCPKLVSDWLEKFLVPILIDFCGRNDPPEKEF